MAETETPTPAKGMFTDLQENELFTLTPNLVLTRTGRWHSPEDGVLSLDLQAVTHRLPLTEFDKADPNEYLNELLNVIGCVMGVPLVLEGFVDFAFEFQHAWALDVPNETLTSILKKCLAGTVPPLNAHTGRRVKSWSSLIFRVVLK